VSGLPIRLCGTEPESIVDGPGFRFVVFTQGCPHHCPGCHNPQSHDFDGGYETDTDKLYAAIAENKHLSGVTFSGGEPFCQIKPLARLGAQVKALGLNLMVYSGYTYEQLTAMPEAEELLCLADILVDGRYVEARRDLTLLFRGSDNQRVIDVKKTRAAGKVTLCDLDY